MQKSRAQHKYDQDGRVYETPAFHTREYVFLEKPSLSSISKSDAQTLARMPFNKLQPKSKRPFRVVSVQMNTVTIE